jgi:HTH-type transcriptional regulator / antitoxin HigA
VEIVSKHVEIGRLLPAWERFREVTDIGPIRDESHYLRMVATLEALLDEAAGDEQHPAMGLIDIVGDLIEDYEAGESPLPEATGVGALAFLMEQHGLVAADLPEIGDEAQIEEVLAQRRELDVRQLRALSQRFGVSPGIFV